MGQKFFKTQHQETLRQQIIGLELENRHLFASSGWRNAIQESSPEKTNYGESCELWQINSTISFDTKIGWVHPVAYSDTDSIIIITHNIWHQITLSL